MYNWILSLNSILLFMILYYVFPLKSLVNSLLGKEITTLESLASLFQLYSMGFVLIFLCLALMYLRAFKNHGNESGPRIVFLRTALWHFSFWQQFSLLYWPNSKLGFSMPSQK